jgi:hypothetical protein
VIALALLVACGEPGAGDSFGTVRAGDVSAEVVAGSAFGVNVNGRAIALLAGAPDLTCEQAVAYARVGSTDDDPGAFVPGGTCGVYVEVPTAYAPAGTTVSDDPTGALVALSCAMGDGAWSREERGDGDVDTYWSGPFWQGSPTGFDLSLSGGDEAPFALTLDMTAYAGSFVYDTENPDPDPATGTVAIDVEVTWCPGLASAVARR